jgi:hypothetical protein
MMGISDSNGAQPCQAPNKNSPTSGLLRFLVARGGIEPPTQGFSTLKVIVFDSRNIAEPCRQTSCPIRTETSGFDWNGLWFGGLDRNQASKYGTLERVDFDQP